MRASMKWPMRALAITGMLTACMISRILLMGAMRATPPSLRMSAGTRSSAITDAAPAFSAITACSALVTSMITPPLSISAKPTFTRNVSSRNIGPSSIERFLNHCLRRLQHLRASFQFPGEDVAQDSDAFPDVLWRQTGETETQSSRLEFRHGKILSRQITDALPLCALEKLAGIQRLGQPDP